MLLAAALILRPRLATASSAEAFRYLPPNFVMAWQVNLEDLRHNALIQQVAQRAARNSPEVDRDYARFVEQTGFDYQRDLDSVSAVLCGPSKATELSLVAEGRFDGSRLAPYMEARSKGRQFYRGREVYVFQGPSGPYRLAFLDATRLAISTGNENSALDGVMSIIDRLENGGPSAEQRLGELAVERHIPEGSQFWMVADPNVFPDWSSYRRDPGSRGAIAVTSGADLWRGSRLLFLSGKVGAQAVEIAAEDDCQTDADAQRLAENMRGFVALLRALSQGGAPQAGPPDPALGQLLDSLLVSVEGKRLLLKATLSAATLIRLFPEERRVPRPPASPAPSR